MGQSERSLRTTTWPYASRTVKLQWGGGEGEEESGGKGRKGEGGGRKGKGEKGEREGRETPSCTHPSKVVHMG